MERKKITFEYNSEPIRFCRSCGKTIFWKKMSSGASMPVEIDTKESHFAHCPNADHHRKKKRS